MSYTVQEVVCIKCGRVSQPAPLACPSRNNRDFVPQEKLLKPGIRWGTYGKDGNEEVVYKELYNCDTEHLIAILKTQTHIEYRTRATIEYILYKREWRKLWKTPKTGLPLLINFKWFSEKIKSLYKKRVALGA